MGDEGFMIGVWMWNRWTDIWMNRMLPSLGSVAVACGIQ